MAVLLLKCFYCNEPAGKQYACCTSALLLHSPFNTICLSACWWVESHANAADGLFIIIHWRQLQPWQNPLTKFRAYKQMANNVMSLINNQILLLSFSIILVDRNEWKAEIYCSPMHAPTLQMWCKCNWNQLWWSWCKYFLAPTFRYWFQNGLGSVSCKITLMRSHTTFQKEKIMRKSFI